MLVDENKLRDVLREAIVDVTDKINRPTTVVEKQIKEMAAHMFNITGGEMMYVLNGRTPVDTMPDDMMFKITKLLYEFIKNNPSDFDVERLNVDKYFNKSEQDKYKKKIDRKIIDKDIVCDYFVPISKDQVIIGLNNKLALKLASMNKIHYNPETQRNLTTIETENGTVQKVTINPNSYNDIYTDMDANDYIPDLLTFNINPDENEQPRIVDGKLIIPKDATIDCIDGYHRLKAALSVTKLKPEWDITFPVMLVGFDVKKAKRYILQEDKKTHLTPEQTIEDDQDNAANFIIDKLSSSDYLKESGITNVAITLNKVINQIYNPDRLKTSEARKKAFDLFKDIEKSFNNLIENNGWFDKKFTKEEWFIYLYLINYCINNDKDFIDIVNKVNINELLEQISITKEPTKQHYKIMSEVTRNV